MRAPTPQSEASLTSHAPSLKQRIKQLRSTVIGFVDHPAFRREGLGLPAELQSALDAQRPPDAGSDLPPLSSDAPLRAEALGSTPPLSKQQEQFLFCRMNYLKFRASTFLEQLDAESPMPWLVDAIERHLADALEIRNRLIQANLRLVVFVANNFTAGSESLAELASHGRLALIRAVEKFNFALGYRFSTYATRAIRNGLIRALQRDHQHRQHYLTGCQGNLERLSDNDRKPAVPEAVARKKHDYLRKLLQQLSDREREIVIGRYALTVDGKKRTLAELAQTLRLSKERVRQIGDRAIMKLHAFARAQPLDLIEA